MQPVVKFLVHTNTIGHNDGNEGIWDRPRRRPVEKYYAADADSYIAKKSINTVSKHLIFP